MKEKDKTTDVFPALSENADTMVLLLDEKLNVIYQSSRITGMADLHSERAISNSFLGYLHPEEKVKFQKVITESLSHPGVTMPVSIYVKHKNGNDLLLEGVIINKLADKDINCIVVSLRDESKRNRAEQKIIKLNSLYHFISQLNQMIIRSADERSLFKEACHIAIGQSEFGMAWIGVINEETKILEPVMHEGIDPDFLATLKIVVDKNDTGKNNAPATALLEGKTVCSNNIDIDPNMKPWRVEAIKRGYLSALAIPIKKSGQVIGSFNLYAYTKNFFEQEEIELLEQATGDISFALDFFEKETLRKKAERDVVESGIRYQTLAETSPVGIFRTDATGYTTYVNPRWCQISGLSCDDAVGNGWLNAVHEDDKAHLLSGWLEATKDHRLSLSEYRFVHADGSVAWVIGQAVPELNSNNEVVGYVGTITDITERKIAEEETKRANIQLALSQKIAHIGYWELDLVNDANYWSEEMYRLTGTEINERPPDLNSYLQYVYPADRELLLNAHRQIIEKKQQLNIEFRFISSDKSICNFHSMGNLISDEAGTPIWIVGITQDITERKKNENEILKEKQLSDSIINSLPGVFYLYTWEGKFLRWNRNLEKITKYNAEEIRNMTPTDFFPEEEKELLSAKIANTFIYREEHVEANFLTKTNEKIPYYFTGIAIDYEGDSCLMGVGIDISDRVAAQEKIKHTSEQLRQLALHLQTIREEERKRIGREIHDELGQQVTAIKMDVAWIDKNIGTKTPEIQNKLKNIIELLDGSNMSIRRILNELRSGILDDHDILDAIEWLGKQFTANTGIPVKFTFPENGLITAAPIANCIFRLYQEAFTNITRYARAGAVTVSLFTHDEMVTASVEDDGVGFDRATVQNNKSFGILGMKERVLSLGGTFDLVSSPGKGTRITISLPLS